MQGLKGERGEEGPIGLPVSVTWPLSYILLEKSWNWSQKHIIHVCSVQQRAYADSVALPAFARQPCSNRSISPISRAHSSKPDWRTAYRYIDPVPHTAGYSATSSRHEVWTFLRYTLGEVTSRNLWSRYDRHFVGIPYGIHVELRGEELSFYSIKTRSVWFKKVSICPSTYQQSVFRRYHMLTVLNGLPTRWR